MQGVAPGAIAQAFLTYFGGVAGGQIAAAAALLVWLLCAMHVMPARAGWFTVSCVMGAWCAAYMVSTVIGWAGA